MDDILNEMAEALRPSKFASLLATARRRIEQGVGEQILGQGRGDAELLKYFLTSKSQEFKDQIIPVIQAIPVIHLSRGEQIIDLWDEVNVPEDVPKDKAYGFLVRAGLRNLAFDSCILHAPDIMYPNDDRDMGKLWILCQTLDHIPSHNYESMQALINGRPVSEFMYFGFFAWVREHGAFDLGNMVVDRMDPSRIGRKQNYQKDLTILETMFSNATVMLAYLSQCPETLVEARPSNPRNPKGSKTAKLKPWLRDDVPHYILINPSKAVVYGCRPKPQDASEATHTKAPHQRRGHWRTLHRGEPGERRVHVRPSWIGPSEWTHRNVAYKIVKDKF